MESWSERQEFLNTVYEGFFQGFSIKQADTHGIVYTPQEIVDFMCNSVEEVLKREFGTCIANPGVQILDPCVGTGSFIVNIIRHHIPRSKLKHKYQHDLFCNEIMLLPYYIASLNIEHEYYERVNDYLPFEGICFADTLNLEGLQMELFSEKNMERIQSEKNAQIVVVIGNPPYNVGQKSENDNNKNRKYDAIDHRIKETYAKDSKATLKTQLYDAYVRFFRWATDRLQGRDGIVCFVSNNGFLNGIAFDGFRKSVLNDFNLIYHFDFKGDARTSGEARRAEGGNIFDDKIRTGIGITLLIRVKQLQERKVFYHSVNDYQSAKQKSEHLRTFNSLAVVPWIPLTIDQYHNWLVSNLPSEFLSFIPIGSKSAKMSRLVEDAVVFTLYSGGVKTNRDTWAYDFNHKTLGEKIKKFVDAYNADLDRWKRRGSNSITVDSFVTYDDDKIKWSEHLKKHLISERYTAYSDVNIRLSLYRPYSKQFLYFNPIINDRQLLQHLFFPKATSENENATICVSAIGSNKSFHCLVVNVLPDFHLTGDSQCFPFYTYAEDGTNRRENITDWALAQFQAKYGPGVTKWDIFHYVYALLHHPQYRERYAENLKRDLPHIPLLHRAEAFHTCAQIGKQLMHLHLHYEQAAQYPLQEIENPDVPFSYRVEKMRLTPDRAALVVNTSLTLSGIPPQCFAYRLGNRSALEWVIDQYQFSEDKRSGIISDPNNLDDEDYIVRLVRQVITVSLETVRLVDELAQAVTMEDWM